MTALMLKIGDCDSDIDSEVYDVLCESFIFIDEEKTAKYKLNGYITFNQLRELCRKNHFSYPLFFADKKKIEDIVEKYNSALYGKINEQQVLTMGARDGIIDIRRMRWIIADIVEKQKIYKTYGRGLNLCNEKIVKFLKKSQESIEKQAQYICDKIEYSVEDMINCHTKPAAFKYLTDKLTAKQIHVFREVRGAMPQNISKDTQISGMYIRDNYHPAIFIGNELSLYPDEGIGRKIYTTMFLVVSVFKDYSFAVKINHENPKMDSETNAKLSEIHEITNEILMPLEYVKSLKISNIKDIKTESEKIKISPTALAVRLAKLGFLKKEVADRIIEELRFEYVNYIKQRRAKDKEKRDAGIHTGPSLKRIYKNYHGDFIDFVRNSVPISERKKIFDVRISYGRSYAKYEDIYG